MRALVQAALGLALACAGPSALAAPPAVADVTAAPFFVIDGAVEGVDRLPLAESIYEIDVSGVVAQAHLTQVYVNEGQTTLDAVYVFPMSTRAAVSALTMRVGERTIVATIQEKQAAKATFDAAKAAGQTASLLEQERPNVFRMNVANVRPGDVVEVELSWVELVTPRDGHYELVVPASVAPRYEGSAEVPWSHGEAPVGFTDPDSLTSPWDVVVAISGGVPIQWLDSPSHTIVKQLSEDEERVTVSLRDFAPRATADFVLRWALDGDAVQAGVLRFDDADASYFLALVQPPERVEPAAVPARDYVFIVDVSGSMGGFPAETARHLVSELLAGLRPTDRFDILAFAGSNAVFAPKSVPATARNIAAARRFMQDAESGGGTELLPALDQAFAMPTEPGLARTFVIITDGYVSLEADAFERVRSRLDKASVFTFGIGSGVNRHLLEGLARAGRGEPFIVEDAARAREVADDFVAYVRSPVLTDVHLAAEGAALFDLEPSSIPDVYADRPIVIVGKLKDVGADARLTVSGVTGRGPWQQTLDLARVASRPHHAALRLLWARERIARLSDHAGPLDARPNEAEVTRLGLAFGLMTAYTSFVAVDDGRVVEAPSVPDAIPGDVFVAGVGGGGMGFSGNGVGGGGGLGNHGIGTAHLQVLGGGGGPSPALVERKVRGEVEIKKVKTTADDETLVHTLLKRRIGAIRHCVESTAQPGWGGDVWLRLRVDPSGNVSDVKVHGGEIARATRECFERIVRRMRMAAQSKGYLVMYLVSVLNRPSPSPDR